MVHYAHSAIQLDTILIVDTAQPLVLVLTCGFHHFSLVTCVADRGIRLRIDPLSLTIALVFRPFHCTNWVHIDDTASGPVDCRLGLTLESRFMFRFLYSLDGNISLTHYIGIIRDQIVEVHALCEP